MLFAEGDDGLDFLRDRAGRSLQHVLQSAPEPSYFQMLRPLFKGPFAAGGGFTKDSGNAMLQSGGADFIVYGKLFTSNPDLPARFQKDAALTDWNPATFYSGTPEGYTDYKSL